MARSTYFSLFVAVLAGCGGEAAWAPPAGGTDGTPSAAVGDSDPVRLTSFQGLSEGLPVGAPVRSTASLDGVVYLVADMATGPGLYTLQSGERAWKPSAVVLQAGERVTSVSRVDFDLYLTAATTAGTGSVYRMELGSDTFTRLTAAPAKAAWAVAVKGSTLWLATSGGLYQSTDSAKTFKLKSAAAPFTGKVTSLIAAGAQARVFAVGDDKAGTGGLYHSDDSGASWTGGLLVKGNIRSIAANGAYVFVESSSSGSQVSDNYGSTFHPFNIGLSVTSFVARGKRVFAGTASGLRISDDSGKTWKLGGEGLPTGAEIRSVQLAGSALLAATPSMVYVAALDTK